MLRRADAYVCGRTPLLRNAFVKAKKLKLDKVKV
jgi:hypothetical protein